MAAFLNSAAASTTNKGKSSAYYGATLAKDKNNPVFQALNSEIKIIYNHIKKRSDPKYIKPDNESCSRCSDTIFELWNRFEPKLQKNIYYKKLLEMGDTLLSMKEYKLALWQCYERYLLRFDCGNFLDISEGRELEEIFFSDGFETEESGFTFRALMGKSICLYQMIKGNDDKLQNKQSVDKCLQILSFLRLLMQIILPKERLCWLIYNGSIHIYTISRHLMSLGHSAQVLEYVIWASVCMETSIPLVSVKYLTWRSTLYTAVCQCYYDCKSPQHAEAFARRGLAKINELNQLERMSNSVQSPQSTVAFRQATIKMAIMVFKRSVFETRRKPKGLLRPKTRANYKDVVNGGWPRTLTEKLMNEMFEGSAAQFLALIETLTDSNRRIILTGPPAQDNEPEILDVYVELFMAGQELLAGGGGLKPSGPKAQSVIGMPPLSGVTEFTSLMESAVLGIDGIPIHSVIKFMKLAFNYEYWDLFDNLVEPVRAYLSITSVANYQWYEKLLELLLAMEKLSHSKKQSKKKETGNEEVPEDEHPPLNPNVASAPGTSMKSTSMNDDHINLADILLSIISGPFQKKDIEMDIIVDSALILWNKCKTVFHKYQTGSVENPRYIQKMDQPYKWMYLLDTVHQTLCWCGISSVDPSLMAEVVIRLAMLYESSAYLDTSDGLRLRKESVSEGKSSSDPSSIFPKIIKEKSGMKDSKTTLTDIGLTEINHSRISMMSSPANLTAKRQLDQAKSILELGLKDMSYARQAVALNDGKSIADVCWVKSVLNDTSKLLPGELNPEVFSHQMNQEVSEVDEDCHGDDLVPDSMKESATTVWNTVKDLHLELILMYHRVCLKLASLKQLDASSKPKPVNSKTKVKENKEEAQIDSNKILKSGEDYENVLNVEDLTTQCKKNYIYKALLFMENALLSTSGVSYNGKQKKLLEESLALIQKAQLEEKRTFLENRSYPEDVRPSKVPPPPILMCRTDTTMVFKPATFIPVTGEKVAWFRIYARNSTGSNVKVRLNDYHLPGTGNQVPVGHDEITVSGLIPNERYVFAVSAYDGSGKMIGGIGETSKPILASHPLPILMTYAFLAQISYQVGYYDVTRQAFDVLWEHFIMEKPAPCGVTHITPVKKDFKLTLHK
ncbi:hypothetical protein LOTGIDRAFT_238728 [Lottia gigantea]|uniref:Fibronectin type-III domain-containing protein n=1 Tax=Lottia gigantea TaxID=225164 RepID=V4A713_LOTGI|nr:hypothetical protein LOTGIDRAFT_238728 [Lottia gigantea]ESO99723.1 hypothetical protein LOTGIDRAFT_238728 [Lottia gigantea]